ncbi:MAG: sugar phosphate permease [Candidatus Hecatellales archaeon B24]|nr:MAG: sugar phosphate permease [Candidatus Hecatellales archaeon B24]
MEAGIIFSVFLATYAVGQIPVGVLAGRFNPAKLMGFGLLLSSAGMLLTATSTHYYAILAFQALAGLGGSAHHPLSLRLISDVFPRDQRGKALGIHGFSSSLGFTLTPAAVAALIPLGWRIPLVLFSVLGFALGALILLAATPEVRPVEKPISLKNLFQVYGFKRLLSMFMMMTLSIRGVGNFLPLFLISIYGIAAAQTGYYYALFYVAGIIQPLTGYLADRVERRRLMLAMVVASSSLITAMALAPWENPIPLVVAAGIAVWSIITLHDALATDLTPREAWGIGYGVLFTASMAAASLSSTLTGLLVEGLGFVSAYIILALILLVEVPLLTSLKIGNGLQKS